jgi:hypothetical protein
MQETKEVKVILRNKAKQKNELKEKKGTSSSIGQYPSSLA